MEFEKMEWKYWKHGKKMVNKRVTDEGLILLHTYWMINNNKTIIEHITTFMKIIHRIIRFTCDMMHLWHILSNRRRQ
jgi:hypothetical protein